MSYLVVLVEKSGLYQFTFSAFCRCSTVNSSAVLTSKICALGVVEISFLKETGSITLMFVAVWALHEKIANNRGSSLNQMKAHYNLNGGEPINEYESY